MRAVLVIACVITLAACSDFGAVVDDRAREGSKGVVVETLATRFPEVSKELLEPFADCVLANAKARELRRFAKATVVGVTDETVSTVKTILTRGETFQCLQQNALAQAQT